MARSATTSILYGVGLFLSVYISTPFVTILSPLGALDALSCSLGVLALCYLALNLPRPAAGTVASLVLLSGVAFNIAGRFYFQQQQTYPSVHTLYLVGEIVSLLEALPPWQLLLAFAGGALAFTAAMLLLSLARPVRTRSRAITAILLAAFAVAAQTGYAKVADEARFHLADSSPLGHMARSTGYVPFARPDQEIAAKHERDTLVRRLRANERLPLPAKYAPSRLEPLLGRAIGERAPAGSSRYPMHRARGEHEAERTMPAAGTNVLVLVLESVRTSEMGVRDDAPSATPFLDSLARKHSTAPMFYATSNFTVKSEHAIHCSALDHMIGEPVSKRETPVRTTCLPKMLSERGYRTLWFHGNDKEFYNRAAYLPKIGFEEIYSRDELDPGEELPTLGWGLPDPLVLDTALDHLEQIDEPFYAEVLTVSNHMPFEYEWGIDFPEHLQPASSMYERYRRGIYYTDQAVKRFHDRFSRSPLARNTLLVITGDHGIWTFPDEPLSQLQKNEMFFRVPLIMQSPDGRRWPIPDIASHLDIAPTLADLLGMDVPDTFMGRSLVRDDPERRNRIVYLMTEQALSYRLPDRACVPSAQCESNINCYREREARVPEAQCYALRRDQDLLDDPEAPRLAPSWKRTSADRALFEYSQIALEIGTAPRFAD